MLFIQLLLATSSLKPNVKANIVKWLKPTADDEFDTRLELRNRFSEVRA